MKHECKFTCPECGSIIEMSISTRIFSRNPETSVHLEMSISTRIFSRNPETSVHLEWFYSYKRNFRKINGMCPRCFANIEVEFDEIDGISIISCEPRETVPPDIIDDIDMNEKSQSYFRMTCPNCGTSFDVGTVFRSIPKHSFSKLIVVRAIPPIMNHDINPIWTDLTSHLKIFPEFGIEKPEPLKKTGMTGEYRFRGPCPRCGTIYRVHFTRGESFQSHDVINVEPVEKMDRNESLFYIVENLGECEDSPLCRACHFNRGNPGQEAFQNCTYWGDVRVMDIALHECLGWAARNDAAKKELRAMGLLRKEPE